MIAIYILVQDSIAWAVGSACHACHSDHGCLASTGREVLYNDVVRTYIAIESVKVKGVCVRNDYCVICLQ